ncbi:MAG: hypothetical protein ACRECH_07970 [Nitrososphaerales archaeon]
MIQISADFVLSIVKDILSWVRQLDFGDYLEIGAGVFSLILSFLAIYAWLRRKQPALIIVAAAFLLFFLKAMVVILPVWENITDPISNLLDIVILALFFIAIVVRPRRAIEIKNV